MAFEAFRNSSKKEALDKLNTEENINPQGLEKLLTNYAFANLFLRDQEIASSLNFKPRILEYKSVIQHVAGKMKSFIDTFVKGMSRSV